MKTHFRTEGIYLVLLLYFLIAFCSSASGQTVTLQLKTKTGRTEFHVGEVILLDLLFISGAPNSYERNVGTALPEELPMPDTFLVEPQTGWADPLGEYRKA